MTCLTGLSYREVATLCDTSEDGVVTEHHCALPLGVAA